MKRHILLSEIEEKGGNEKWRLSLTPPRKPAVIILSSPLGTGRSVRVFLTSAVSSVLVSWSTLVSRTEKLRMS